MIRVGKKKKVSYCWNFEDVDVSGSMIDVGKCELSRGRTSVWSLKNKRHQVFFATSDI